MARPFDVRLAALLFCLLAVASILGCSHSAPRTDATEFASVRTVELSCGGLRAIVRYGAERAVLEAGGETVVLRPVRSASGARYVAPGDPTTWVWNEGERTTVSLHGQTLPECRARHTPGEPAVGPYRARGNEPFWSLEVVGKTMTFRTPEAEAISAEIAATESLGTGRKYVATYANEPFTASIIDRQCSDGMSGMPYPHFVTVTIQGKEYKGCGGETADLLQGAPWGVDSLANSPLVEGTTLTILFEEENAVSGTTSCNTFRAPYTLDGEKLEIGNPVATLQACAPAVMDQESRFFELLRAVRRFELDAATHTLVLHTEDGRSIAAHR
jgi:uncharacterized membrane protein